MKNKKSLKQLFLALALVFVTVGVSFGQCVIPIADDQPYIEDFEGDGFDCWSVDVSGGGSWSLLAGTNSTVVSFSYHNNEEAGRLISPIFDMSAVDGAIFSFSYAMMGFYTNDELEVAYL